ncbi:MAG TPA: L-rhamnose/proton symporter RhaT [Candidatus Limnocylindrales bacterium]|nr:L-rhamnose/proton symporter RhaT [Candidatus Limnocylindrales bacterium]
MTPNPALGVGLHWLGGLASASFYVPYRWVKRWSWETFWLAGGIFSWLVAPWLLAWTNTRDLFAVLSSAPASTLFWVAFFGLLWGVGGLTYGLTMRYLGLSLGMAVVLGLCAAFGTLVPPILHGVFVAQVLGTTSGRIILFGVFVCLLGITVAGLAGLSKERVMPAAERNAVIQEFNLRKGIAVAVLSGVMSACFALGLSWGDPIRELTLAHGTAPIWQGLAILPVLLAGGFLTNFVWCLILHARNKSGREYFSRYSREGAKRAADEITVETALDAESREVVEHSAAWQKSRSVSNVAVAESPAATELRRVPMLANYLLCAVAGTTWYFQFFFYTMGESQMGKYKFSSWTLHMASIIIFGSLWGIGFKEWKGAGRRASSLLALAVLLLVASTVVVGYGNYIAIAH